MLKTDFKTLYLSTKIKYTKEQGRFTACFKTYGKGPFKLGVPRLSKLTDRQDWWVGASPFGAKDEQINRDR